MTKTRTLVDDDLDADPILIPHEGRLKWLFPSGFMLPDVRGGDGPDDEKKHSDADMNRIVQQRLEQERRNNPGKPADYDDVKAELARLKASQGTELDQAKARISELEGKLATAETERDTARGETAGLKLDRVEDAFRTAVERAARTSNNPEQVYALLDKSKLTLGDDGQVKGADEAVKTFLETNPHFVGTPGRRQPAPDAGQGKPGDAKTFGEAGRAEALRRFGNRANSVVAAGNQQ